VVREASKALALLPDEDRISRARVYVALGTAQAYQDETQSAIQTWSQARDLALEAGNPFLATSAIEMLTGTLIYHQGGLRAAERDLLTVLDLAATPGGRRLPFSCTAHALLAEIYLEWNQLERAAAYLETGRELLRQSGICYGRLYAACARARLAYARGDPREALVALHEAGETLDEHGMLHMALHLAACQVRLRLCLGDVETAASWAAADPAVTGRELPETLPSYLRGVQRLSFARVALARGDAARALAVLDGLDAQALAAGRKAQAIEAGLLQALALQAEGHRPGALPALERSLSLAEPEGYLRLYLEAGPGVLPLLREAAAQEICPRYTGALLAAWDAQAGEPDAPPDESRSGTDRVPARPRGGQIDPLTPREQEVLHLICAGLSNREIAERLTVTLNTVKKHTSNLYDKLGVRSRTQAIARAQTLDLL
jgi:LuxR family maltose regulon positive regulatory protein